MSGKSVDGAGVDYIAAPYRHVIYIVHCYLALQDAHDPVPTQVKFGLFLRSSHA